MINKEWEDFFGIEEASDTSYIETDFNIKQKDAVAVLASCINANGYVDLNWMCEASGLSMDELIHSLHGAIYQDPEVYDLCHADDQGWMLRAQYLSGHIKFKLETAKRLNHKYNDRFAANVAALKSIMPPKSDFDAIGFSIGSPWIPNEYYEAFAKDILGLARAPKISHSAALGRYHVKIASKYQDTVPNLFTYGTLHFSGLLLIEYALNGITPKPYDDVVRLDRKSGIARVLNKTESLAAQEKINLLQKAFSDFFPCERVEKNLLQHLCLQCARPVQRMFPGSARIEHGALYTISPSERCRGKNYSGQGCAVKPQSRNRQDKYHYHGNP